MPNNIIHIENIIGAFLIIFCLFFSFKLQSKTLGKKSFKFIPYLYKFSIFSIVLTGIFIALYLFISTFIEIQIGIIKIEFNLLLILLASYILGPFYGGIIGLCGNLLSVILYNAASINLILTFSRQLIALIPFLGIYFCLKFKSIFSFSFLFLSIYGFLIICAFFLKGLANRKEISHSYTETFNLLFYLLISFFVVFSIFFITIIWNFWYANNNLKKIIKNKNNQNAKINLLLESNFYLILFVNVIVSNILTSIIVSILMNTFILAPILGISKYSYLLFHIHNIFLNFVINTFFSIFLWSYFFKFKKYNFVCHHLFKIHNKLFFKRNSNLKSSLIIKSNAYNNIT